MPARQRLELHRHNSHMPLKPWLAVASCDATLCQLSPLEHEFLTSRRPRSISRNCNPPNFISSRITFSRIADPSTDTARLSTLSTCPTLPATSVAPTPGTLTIRVPRTARRRRRAAAQQVSLPARVLSRRETPNRFNSKILIFPPCRYRLPSTATKGMAVCLHLPNATFVCCAASGATAVIPSRRCPLTLSSQTNLDAKDGSAALLRDWHHFCPHRRPTTLRQLYSTDAPACAYAHSFANHFRVGPRD